MQQVIISLGADAVRQEVGSTDLETVLAFSPDRLIKAVHDGEIEAESILKSTLEIDGRMGRLQAEGQPDYSIVDGEQMATHRSEEHTSELQSLMRISYAVFCLKKKKKNRTIKQQ